MGDLIDGLIYKSNALIQSTYTISLVEQKIILAAVSQVRRDEVVTDDVRYVITANALANVAGFVANNEYRALKAGVDRLWKRTLVIHEEPNGGKAIVKKIRWIQEVVYVENDGVVEIRFSKAILPYLNQLSSGFTNYKFRHIAGMRSTYGVRLYELLAQWRSKGKREIEIDLLRKKWELLDKYQSIKDFKLRVINPAILDVNEHSDLWVKFSQKKTGRKVSHLQFEFGVKIKNTQEALRLPGQMIMGVSKKEIEKHANPGESYEQVAARILSKRK